MSHVNPNWRIPLSMVHVSCSITVCIARHVGIGETAVAFRRLLRIRLDIVRNPLEATDIFSKQTEIGITITATHHHVNRTNVLVHVPTRPAHIQLLETEDTSEGDTDAVFSEPLNRWIKKLPEAAIWSEHLERYVIPEANMVWIESHKKYLIQPPGTVWNGAVDSFDRLADGIGTGVLAEEPCPPSWAVYTDERHTYQGRTLYQSWLKMGNLKGAYFGHDHMNTFDVTDQNGIRLGFCKAATLSSYNDGDPGFRIFDISADGTYETESVTAKQLGIIE